MMILEPGQHIAVKDAIGDTIAIRTDGESVVVDEGSTAYLICFACTGNEAAEVQSMDRLPWIRRIDSSHVAAIPGPVAIHGMVGVVIIRVGYVAIPTTVGPVERTGRLKYIDGCTDSLLIGPPRKGDPCLNHLHFPFQIEQTMHTHPSVRAGMILRGRGRCVMPDGVIPLEPGMSWVLPAGRPHCFYTGGETMDVVAYHPDSDFGPIDNHHPMINRTMVDGVSASRLDHIRTK